MRQAKSLFLLLLGGILLVIGASFLLTPEPVKAHPLITRCILAQCGSQTSSCKDCHEVQGKDPVNNDGTSWHQSHAFGDFCVLCHSGNDQTTDRDTAHIGMVPPLSDINASCKSCHANDVQERAEVYAKILNVEIGTGAAAQDLANLTITPVPTPTLPAAQTTVSAPVSQPASVSVPSSNELLVNDPNALDYVQRYNEIVLGEHPVNWGNIILVILIAVIALGGGGFIVLNEVRLRTAPAANKRIEGEYPADVVDMLPNLVALKLHSRQSLKNILNNPKKTDRVLEIIETLVSDEPSEEEGK